MLHLRNKRQQRGTAGFAPIMKTAKKQPDEAIRLKLGLLNGLADSMVNFLVSGDHKEANALLLRYALSQTQSECGFVGVVEEGCLPRILARAGSIRPRMTVGLTEKAGGGA